MKSLRRVPAVPRLIRGFFFLSEEFSRTWGRPKIRAPRPSPLSMEKDIVITHLSKESASFEMDATLTFDDPGNLFFKINYEHTLSFTQDLLSSDGWQMGIDVKVPVGNREIRGELSFGGPFAPGNGIVPGTPAVDNYKFSLFWDLVRF